MGLRLYKQARHFGLDAVQGNKEERTSRMEEYGERVTNAADAAMRQEGWQSLGFAQSRLARPKGSGGFTIVELTIATAVFAAVLLVGLSSFLGVGKVFYKGLTHSQTQSAAQQILDRISADVQFGSTIGSVHATGTGDSQYICLGNIRYSYNLYKPVDLGAHDVNQNQFGLLRDGLPSPYGCGSPFGDFNVPFNNPTELLGEKMRLSKMDITPVKDAGGSDVKDLWSVNLTVAYGDDSSLQDPLSPEPACNSNLANSQFCSVVKLNTSVTRGL